MTDSSSKSADDQRPETPRREDHAWRAPRAVIIFFATAVLLLTVDLVSKHVAFDRVAGEPAAPTRDTLGQLAPLPPHEPVTLIPRVLAVRLTMNEGAVFGLGQGGRWMFVAFSLLAAIVIVSVFCRSSFRALALHLALAAVLAGAIGNLVDRLAYGAVRDLFWLFPGVRLPFGWHWPGGSNGLYPWIFNVADVCLVVGLVLLMFLMYHADRRAASGTNTISNA